MGRKSTRAGVLAGSLVSLALVSTAQAHMAVEGMNDMTNGALHPLMSPAHVLVLVGLALLLGQQLPFDLKIPVRTFAPASAIALALTTTGRITDVFQPVLVVISLCLGALVGLEVRMPRWALGLICVLAAVAIGFDSGLENGAAFVQAKTLLGTWFAVNAVVFYLAICASNGTGRKWARTGIRVIGSWIIAISLMVLAFSFVKK